MKGRKHSTPTDTQERERMTSRTKGKCL